MTRYLLLIIGASWLLAYQLIMCMILFVNSYNSQVDSNSFDFIDYISVGLTVIICIFTISAAKQKRRQLQADRKNPTP